MTKSPRAIANFCNYVNGQVSGFNGYCSAMRAFITYAHFFKYLLDNNLETATGLDASTTITTNFV